MIMADQTITIPKGWKVTTLGDVADIKGGKRLPMGKSLVTQRTKHPYIRITDIENNKIKKGQLQFVPDDVFSSISRYIVNSGDVIVSIVGSIGFVAKIDDDLDNASLTENCVKFVNLNNLDSKYLYYFLTSKSGQNEIERNTVGAVQKKLPIYGVQNIQILLPLINEQQAIAAILSSLDDKIELLREQNKTLEATAQVIFKEWFVNFNFPGATGKMIDSELGKIPEGWKVVSFDEIMKFTPGTYIPKEDYENNGDNFIYGSNSVMGNTNQKTHSGPIIILAKIGTYCGAIRFSHDDCWINNNAGGIQGLNISTALIFEILKHFDFSIVREGSGQPYINMSGLKMQKFAIPKDLNSEFFKKISQSMDSIYLKIAGNQRQIQTLSKLRDTLLPKLMKGEVRVAGFNE